MTTATDSTAVNGSVRGLAEPLVDEVCRALKGAVPRPRVERVVNDLLERYGDAPVTAYLSIIVRRHARERLRGERADAAAGRQRQMHSEPVATDPAGTSR